jgi:hypothetical protein
MRGLGQRVWDYLRDLGTGGWLLILAGVVAVAVVVAVIQGRGGPDKMPCDQAQPSVSTISKLSQSGRLSAVEAAQLHNAATQLSAIAGTSSGDDQRAIKDAAAAAAGAEAGQPFNAVEILDEFDAACPSGGLR